jgi:hypothetical protein
MEKEANVKKTLAAILASAMIMRSYSARALKGRAALGRKGITRTEHELINKINS